mgnify:CR=1 FL=1|jgi:hypothetical protein
MNKSGFVYGFKNESMPGLIKIGRTVFNPLKRLCEANLPDTYKPPTYYIFYFAIKVPDSSKAEAYIHKLLEKTRVNMNREFFRISLEDVTNIINNHMNIINGEWWTPPIGNIIPEQQLTKKLHGLPWFGASSKVFKKKSVKHLNNLFETFKHLYKNICDLQLLTEDHVVMNDYFTREQLKLIKYDYKTSPVKEIHRLCNKQVFNKRDIDANGKLSNFSEKRVVTILNTQLNHIGYKINKTTHSKRINGKAIRIYNYQIVLETNNNFKNSSLNYKIFKSVNKIT